MACSIAKAGGVEDKFDDIICEASKKYNVDPIRQELIRIQMRIICGEFSWVFLKFFLNDYFIDFFLF